MSYYTFVYWILMSIFNSLHTTNIPHLLPSSPLCDSFFLGHPVESEKGLATDSERTSVLKGFRANLWLCRSP